MLIDGPLIDRLLNDGLLIDELLFDRMLFDRLLIDELLALRKLERQCAIVDRQPATQQPLTHHECAGQQSERNTRDEDECGDGRERGRKLTACSGESMGSCGGAATGVDAGARLVAGACADAAAAAVAGGAVDRTLTRVLRRQSWRAVSARSAASEPSDTCGRRCCPGGRSGGVAPGQHFTRRQRWRFQLVRL